jgi:hypothetical protein
MIRKLITLVLLLSLPWLPQSAFAYITLTTPFTASQGGTQVENDTIGACTSITYNFQNFTESVTFNVGMLSGSPQNLAVGPLAQSDPNYSFVVTVNLATGAWTDTQGGSGTVPGSILSGQVTQFEAARNQAESFVGVSGGLMPGTITQWPASTL